MSAWDIITDDWKKIPQNFRYLLLFGAFLIFNTWLLDHWFSDGRDPYRLFGCWDFRSFGYSTGFILIATCFILLIAKQIPIFGRVLIFRKKYPISKLDDSFHLVWFNKRLFLFDNEKKEYFHIYPWETAQDLLFTSYGEKKSEGFPTEKNQIIDFPNGRTIETANYKNGGMINTRA